MRLLCARQAFRKASCISSMEVFPDVSFSVYHYKVMRSVLQLSAFLYDFFRCIKCSYLNTQS